MMSSLSATLRYPRLAAREAIKLFRAYSERDRWNHLVIHRPQYVTTPAALAVPVICGPVKGQLRSPPEMTLVLVHNYDRETVMEKCLRYVGIDDFVVLRPQNSEAWRHSAKITTILDYIRSGACKTEFIFYCDSNDAFLRDDPAKAIAYLHQSDCDLLFSTVPYSHGYECMPATKAWANDNACKHGYSNLYINAGVFVGRTAHIQEVFQEATRYITPNDLSAEEYMRFIDDGTLCSRLPDYPKGVGTDQVILRFLHPEFYPLMKCDYAGRLALR
jgi:hypothetical protein